MSCRNLKILDHVPNQVRDYMRGVNTRFNEICDIYLTGLSIDDLKYLCPTDLIKLVPHEQYNHKLLMTIMVRRYIYPNSCDKRKKDCSNKTDKEPIYEDEDEEEDDEADHHHSSCNRNKCTRCRPRIYESV